MTHTDDNDFEIRHLLAKKYTVRNNWLADKQSDSKPDNSQHLRGIDQNQLWSMTDEWWKAKAEEIQGYVDSKKMSNSSTSV